MLTAKMFYLCHQNWPLAYFYESDLYAQRRYYFQINYKNRHVRGLVLDSLTVCQRRRAS